MEPTKLDQKTLQDTLDSAYNSAVDNPGHGVNFTRTNRTMRRIAIINQKGGVGKTTTTANLGAGIGRKGFSVVLVDLDPQANLTTHFGLEIAADVPGVYHLLTQHHTLAEALQPVGDNLLLAPSHIDLAAAEVELASVVGREIILRDAVEQYPKPYEFMFIDCPPSLGILTLNALCAADEVFITLQPHFLALQGLGKLLETVNLVARRINHRLRVSGIIMCMYESGTKLANEVAEDLEHFFETSRQQRVPWSDLVIFKARIRRNIKLAEAPSFGVDIHRYAPQSHGAEDYQALADEVLKHYGYKILVEAEQPPIESETPAEETSLPEIDNVQLSPTIGQNQPHPVSADPVDPDAYTSSRSDP
jgi:chromosome partitioning protein